MLRTILMLCILISCTEEKVERKATMQEKLVDSLRTLAMKKRKPTHLQYLDGSRGVDGCGCYVKKKNSETTVVFYNEKKAIIRIDNELINLKKIANPPTFYKDTNVEFKSGSYHLHISPLPKTESRDGKFRISNNLIVLMHKGRIAYQNVLKSKCGCR